MQLSHVFNQRAWPGAGDVDDCTQVSGLQLVNTVAPWLPLVDIPTARRAAGDPDDGNADGGTQAELLRMLRTLYPSLAPLFRRVDGCELRYLRRHVDEGRPVSVALIGAKLPTRLRFGFTGSHRCTIARASKGAPVRFANPLAPVYSDWQATTWAQLAPALEAHAGKGRANVILGPTVAEAIATQPDVRAALLALEGARLEARAVALRDASAAVAALR